MAKVRQVHCPVCERDLAASGWNGHTRNKAHIAGLEAKGFSEVEPIQLDAVEPPSEVELRKQYEDRIARLEEQLEKARPDKTSPVLTAENVGAVVGEAHLKDAAENRLAVENKKRLSQSLKPLWDSPAELDFLLKEEIEKLKVDLVEKQSGFAKKEGGATRTLKMVHPNGNLVQNNIEDQVNNGAAGPGVNIYLYRDKGYKIADPYRCEVKDCWLEATQTRADNVRTCSPAHSALLPPKRRGGDRQVLAEFSAK